MGFFGKLFGPPAQEAEQPDLVQRPYAEEVRVRIVWLAPEQMREEYSGQVANTVTFLNGAGERCAVIRAVQPEDFNDIPRLVSLGHELFHALGATHA